MCSPQIILDKFVEKIVDAVIQSVVRHVRFVTRYKENLENLDAEKKILEGQQVTINEKVRNAEILGEDIIADVTNWLTEANKMRQEVEDFMNPETVKENMQCFAVSCPDYISRYQLSKQIEKKIGDVKNLTQKGKFDKVSNPKPPPEELEFPPSGDSVSLDYMTFDSRESVFKRIMDALQDSKVYKIGVYGIGGVGKTTMVKEVGKQVKKDGLFDEVVMAVVSQDANVSQIQLQLGGDLNPKLANVEKATNEHERAKLLWPRLNNGRKNLIILDDIWKELNLHAIGIPITDENKGCKVVITTRNRDVLKNMHIDKEISIQELSQPEAWDLFKKKVGNYVDCDQELNDIAVQVCKECQGLPVAILAVGAALKGKEKYAWENALKKFKKSMLKKIEGINPGLYTSLKLSYDLLESMDAKSCFLLCCLFPEDVEISIDDLVRHCIARRLLDQKPDTLKEARDTVRTVVHTLKSYSLLLDGSNEYVIKMHDVIRDVAISIAEDEKAFLVKHGDGVQEWPEKSTCESSLAISLRSKTIHEFPNELGCPQLHTLLLECSNPLVIIPEMFFSGMEKLTVLNLNNMRMLCLPSSLANLVNLRMLYLNYCELKDITILKNLKNNLEILSLRGSDIEVLPSEIGQLTHLRLLDLGDCNNLTEIPQGVLSNLSRLEELYMLDGFDQWEATTSNKETSNVSLVELRKFTQLTTLEIQVPNLMLLPKDLCFENLIRFKISICHSFGIYEDYSRIFKFKGVSLNDEFNVLLERAELLDLNNLEGLQKMHDDRGGEGFLFQSYRPDTSRSFNKLTKLTIRGCKLKYLFSPSCARGLLQLQELNVQKCEIMEEIVGIEGEKDKEELTSQVINFSQLKRMELEDLHRLISFYPKMEKATTSDGNSSIQSLFNEKVDFPLLEDLNIDTLPNITEIWDKQLLTVSNDDIITFHQLKRLSLQRLKNLKSFCSWPTISETQPLFNHQVDFPILEYLEIDMLPNITEIWDKQLLTVPQRESNSICQLQSMRVYSCENMMNVVRSNDDIITFPQLNYLRLQDLMNLKSFCSWPTISETQPLFNHQVVFPALEGLIIINVPTITEILDSDFLSVKERELKSFSKLTSMEVWHCEKMVNVVPSNMVPPLQNLKQLKVSECPKMEAIVLEKTKEKKATNDDIILFSQLTTLRLDSLINLKSFYSSPTRSEAQPLFNHQVVFPALESCYRDFLSVKERELKSFYQLTSMKVLNCEKMVNVVPSNMVPQLQNLKQLLVSDCPKMEAIVLEKTKEKKATNDDIILFPQLTTLNLDSLINLKSFYSSPTRSEAQQPLFNHQVDFPLLEDLYIRELPNITEIWDKQLLTVPQKESNYFCQLRSMRVFNCENMMNVIRSNDDIITFPQLKDLHLGNLKNLKSFCNWTTRSETQPLFNHQVDFPLLEYLKIDMLPNITEIWDKQLLTIPQKDVAFPKLEELHLHNCVNLGEIHLWNVLVSEISLKVLSVEKCGQESTVVSHRLVQRLQYLDKLIVRNCGGVTEVFQLEELNVGEREGQHQHGRPLTKVRMMELDSLPQLTCLWNKDPRGILRLESLQYLVIKKCSLLRNLLTCSTTRALQQLKVLYLESCTLMEQVIATDEGGHKEEVTGDDDEIEFPKLEWLILKDLPNLNSFCNVKNCNFNFPSLKRVVLKRCPKMQTFTFGQVRMSQVLISTRGNQGIQTEDLNKYLTEQQLLKGEESATMDENDYEEDDYSEGEEYDYGEEHRYSNLLWLQE